MRLINQNTAIETLYSGIVVGVIIGAGIYLSIAILLYFTLAKKLRRKIASYFLLLFGVGQLIQGLQLLEQVDIISSHVALWSTNYLTSEDSELGYFLSILFWRRLSWFRPRIYGGTRF
jgi:high-affinity iron transporter